MKYLFRILDKFRSGFAAALLLIGAPTQNSLSQSTGNESHAVTLKRGQVLQMKLVKRLSSGRAQVGDDVVLRLSEPILAEGETLLAKGSAIHGRIRAAKRAANNCQPGSIDWELEPLTMPGDAKIEIRFLEESIAKSRLLDQAARDTATPGREASASEGAPRKKGSSVGGILKGIAVAPLMVVVFPLQVLSEGEAWCPGGKGREESFWKGKPFFAEVAADVRISVH